MSHEEEASRRGSKKVCRSSVGHGGIRGIVSIASHSSLLSGLTDSPELAMQCRPSEDDSYRPAPRRLSIQQLRQKHCQQKLL